jgi:hypothetical protein
MGADVALSAGNDDLHFWLLLLVLSTPRCEMIGWLTLVALSWLAGKRSKKFRNHHVVLSPIAFGSIQLQRRLIPMAQLAR